MHPLELGGVVVLEVRREAESVAKRVRQQARAGRRAHQREGGEVERDAGRPRALADHDVDAEVLHREVQHLLRGARHAVHLVDEEHLAGGQTRQQRREVARVLDRRAARQAQRAPALVGDDHRERGLAEPGRARRAGCGRRAAAACARHPAAAAADRAPSAGRRTPRATSVAARPRSRARTPGVGRDLGAVVLLSHARPPWRAGPSAASVSRSSACMCARSRRRRHSAAVVDGLGRRPSRASRARPGPA